MKNKIFKTLVLVAVSIILIKNIDVFKKTYFLLTKNYDQRFIDAYNRYYFSGFCSKQAHGYIRYIKTKYKNKISPKIINLEKSRRIPYWIFYNASEKILDENKLILLNYEEKHSSLIENFSIIDNFRNKCLYLEKKNGNN